MRRKILSMVIFTMLFCMCACKGKKFDEMIDPLSFIDEYEGKDNTKDAYTRVYMSELLFHEEEEPNDEWMVRSPMIGKGNVFVFGNAINEAGDGYNSILCLYSAEDGEKKEEIEMGSKSFVYPVAGKNDYFSVFAKINEDGPKYEIEIYNETNTVTRNISLDFVPVYEDRVLWNIAIDIRENIHIIQVTKNIKGTYSDFVYQVLTKEGKLLYSEKYENAGFVDFISSYEGEILCHYSLLQNINNENGIREVIENVNANDIERIEFLNDERLISKIAFDNNDKMYFTDKEGIWVSDKKMEDLKEIYSWTNHGMSGENIVDLKVCENNKVQLITYDENLNIYRLYVLKPTSEENDMPEIKIAIPSWKRAEYSKAISEFNKKFPTCKISVIDNYDDLSLRTQLIAGDGPVLIDTSLIDFQENKEYWLQLDVIYKDLGTYEKLNKAALTLGEIEGELYGAVIDYSIETVLSGLNNHGWTFEDFIREIEKKEYKYIFMEEGNTFVSILDLLGTNEKDSYFIDKEGKTAFNTPSFNELLNTLERYSNSYIEKGTLEPSDEVLCQRVTIRRPEQLWVYMIKNKGKNDFVGYPSYYDAYNVIRPETRVVIRKSASKVEKELAVSFLQIMLSYDFQLEKSEKSMSLSIREDVLETQIKRVHEGMPVIMDELYEDIYIEGEVDTNMLRETLFEIIDSAIPREYGSKGYSMILHDEFGDYFSGQITREMLINHLESRINLYLEENR